jgi:acetoin utilization protein AcuB
MLINSVMTSSVITAEPGQSLLAARRVMHEGRFRHLPVVRAGALVGIISDRDLSRHNAQTVADVMNSNVIVVNPDTPVEVAAQLMVDNKIGALPVVSADNDMLVGIVSQTDLFSVLARLLGGDGPSTRLELVLDDLPAQLAIVATLAQQSQIGITSLVTLPAEHGRTQRRLVLRIGSIVARPFVAELRSAGIHVDLPDELNG